MDHLVLEHSLSTCRVFLDEVGDVINAVAVGYPHGSTGLAAAVMATDLIAAVQGGSSGQTLDFGDFDFWSCARLSNVERFTGAQTESGQIKVNKSKGMA